MDYQVIGVVVTQLGLIYGTWIKYKTSTDKIMKKIDEQQNEQIKNLNGKITLLEDKLDNLYHSVTTFLEATNFKSSLKDDISIIANQIIHSNPDLDSNIKTLLYEGRNFAIKFGKEIYFSKVPPDKTIFQNESNTIFDNLKIIANHYFQQKKVVKDCELTFAQYLRQYTNITLVTYHLIESLLSLIKDREKYNGTYNQKFINLFTGFVSDMYLEGITAWREFNKLPNA